MLSPAQSSVIGRIKRAIRGRLAGGEEGFLLIETLIAITLITVIMGAIGVEYVSGLVETNRARLQTTAVQLANNTMETLRSYDPSDVVTARGKKAVDNEFKALSSYSNAADLLGDSSLQVYDKTAAETSGSDATVPTNATPQRLGGVNFSVWQYLECSSAPTDGACLSSLGIPSATQMRNLRAIVVVTWNQSVCAGGTCSYATSTLINPDPDLTYDLNQPLPPAPIVNDPGALSVAIGDKISLQLATTSANAGVTPLTWAQTGSVPNGLPQMSTAGLIAGTVGGAATANSTGTVTTGAIATDAYQRPSPSQSLSWTVKPALRFNTISNQANVVGDSVNLNVTATGGSGTATNYAFSDPNSTLPNGLSISSAGLITGTPTAPGARNAPKVYNTVLTVTDSELCSACVQPRTSTVSFTWTINYPPVSITVPSPQTWTVGTNLAVNSSANGQVQMSASGGDNMYSWSATGLPTGVTIDAASGLISSITPPSTTGSGTARITATDVTASNDTSSAAYSQTVSFSWQVVARPTVAAITAQRNSIGAPVNLATTATCPNAPCGYSLSGAPAGLGIDSTGKITGTIAGGATTSSQAKVTVTDSAGASATTGAFTWTIVAAPTITGWSTQRVTETEVYSLALPYQCPYTTCTIALAPNSQVPGLGLKTTAAVSGDNSASKSLPVSAASGTVYLTGTVQNTAVTAGNTADYAAALSITSADNSVSSYSATFTAAVVPTISGLAAKKVSETAAVSTAITYTCYAASASTPCTITLSGAVGLGLGLSTSATVVGDNSGITSLTVTSTTGTVYIAGTVSTGAVTGTDTSKTFTPSLTISPDTFYTSAANTATWTAYIAPTVVAPVTQRNTIGAAVSFSLSSTCAATPCSYTSTNLPAGLTIDANGLVSGTIASSAASSSAVRITVTDTGGATASTTTFTWTIDAAPTVTGLTANRAVTVGGVYSNANAVSLAYTCPRTNCTITLGGSPVPGLGLNTDRTQVGNQTGRSLTVTAASGTVYVVGQVQSTAVTSGTSTVWTPSIAITDGGNFTAGPTSATWTAFSAPTASAPGTRNVSVGGVESTAISYTCPAAARTSCVVTLATTVPGVGLSTSANQASNNTTLTLTTASASGTVYLTGSVQSSALGGNASKAWTPSLTITDGGVYTSTASSGTWTAYPAPTLGTLSTPRSLTEGSTDSVAITYTCPDSSCSVLLNGSIPGLGLSAAPATTAMSATSVNVTAATGTLYVTGLVSSSAVPSAALSQVYTPAVTINDGANGAGNYTSSASSATWTAYSPPTINTGPSARAITVGAIDSTAYSYTCPRTTCTLTLTNPVPGLGLSTSAGTSGNNTVSSISITSSGTNTVYIAGTVQTSAAAASSSKQYSVGLQITDGGRVSSGTSSATWTAYGSKPTVTGLTAQTARRNQVNYQQLNYTCPTQSCSLSVAGPSWVTLGNNQNDTFKSTVLTQASGSLYVGGQPGTNDSGGTITLTMTDGSSTTVTLSAAWGVQ